MDNLLQASALMVIPLMLGLLAYFGKNIFERVDKLEEKSFVALNDTLVRTILDDKLSPLKEDINEIKALLSNFLGLNIGITKRKSSIKAKK